MRMIAGLILLSIAVVASAHQEAAAPPNTGKAAKIAREKALKEITITYDRDVKSIFGAKCFDCHSRYTRYPWYHHLPLVKNLIDADIREALKHLDMSDGFPFKSHGIPEGDLQDIRDEVEDGGMPPWNYRLMHWGSGLNAEEKRKVLDWIDEGLKTLGVPTE